MFGVEALLRWNHPIYGFIYPPLIIALAEEADLNNKLGEWILEQACSDLRKLKDSGIHDTVMSVNIVASQLKNNAFISTLACLMDIYEIETETIQLEVTERVTLFDGPTLFEKLHDLKEMGILLAMDDFGMGHSSLMYLKEHGFDTVKLNALYI